MPDFYITGKGSTGLSLDEVVQIAQHYQAILTAVDHLPLQSARTQPLSVLYPLREYLFQVEAPDIHTAEQRVQTILASALHERNKPRYQQLDELLLDSNVPRLEARYIQENEGERSDLVITLPATDTTREMIYYRSDIGYACLELLAKFTKLIVVDE